MLAPHDLLQWWTRAQRFGNWVARSVDQSKAGHYAHAVVYCLLARKSSARRG